MQLFIKRLDKRLSSSKLYIATLLLLFCFGVVRMFAGENDFLNLGVSFYTAALILQLLFHLSRTIVEDYLQ